MCAELVFAESGYSFWRDLRVRNQVHYTTDGIGTDGATQVKNGIGRIEVGLPSENDS